MLLENIIHALKKYANNIKNEKTYLISARHACYWRTSSTLPQALGQRLCDAKELRRPQQSPSAPTATPKSAWLLRLAQILKSPLYGDCV
jgi:hypothetical protein